MLKQPTPNHLHRTRGCLSCVPAVAPRAHSHDRRDDGCGVAGVSLAAKLVAARIGSARESVQP